MASDRALSIGLGIAQGFEKASKNLYAISQAKQKQKREDEAFGLEKKVKNAQFKQYEHLYGEDRVAHDKALWQTQEKKAKADLEEKRLVIKNKEREQTERLKYFGDLADKRETYLQGFGEGTEVSRTAGMFENMRGAAAPEEPMSELDFLRQSMTTGESVDVGGRTVKGTATVPTRAGELQKKEALELLRIGVGRDSEGEYELQDKDEAIQEVMKKYTAVDLDDPDIQNALARYKVREEDIEPSSKGFFGFGEKKYPTKRKYGNVYEQREDGKWHVVE